MYGNIGAITDAAKNMIETHLLDLFNGIALNRRMAGKTLGAALIEAKELVDSFISGRRSSNPGNPAVFHMNEYSAKHLAKFLEYIKTLRNENDKMNVPPNDRDSYEKMGIKWTNAGIFGLNRQIRLLSHRKNSWPHQAALMGNNQHYRAAG